jgi:hypothetical protein
MVSDSKHSNGYYYTLSVPDGANVTISNGSIDIKTNSSSDAAVAVATGAEINLKNVALSTNGAGVMPASTASKVNIENSTIIASTYGIGTNRLDSSLIKLVVKNTTIKSNYIGVLINCASNVIIDDCEIEGAGWGVFIRAGSATISDTIIKTTDGDVGYNNTYSCSYKNFKYTQNRDGAPYWGEGFQCPYSVLTLGDYSNNVYYSGDVVCTLENVTIVSPNEADIPGILCAAQMADKNVTLTYDGECQVGKVVTFGDDYDYATNGHPTIVHNGTITINN